MIALLASIAVCAAPVGTVAPITASFLYSLARVERAGGSGDGTAGERGPFQIRPIYLADVVRICGLLGMDETFQDSDRRSWQRSALMTRIYLGYWAHHWAAKGYSLSHADLCSMHRFGGPAWTPERKSSTQVDRERTARLDWYMNQTNK